MALKMAQPWKHPRTGMYWFRKAVPLALQPKVGKREVQITLRTKDPEEARRLLVKVAAKVQEHWDALGASPLELKPKHIHGLAGEFYRWVIAKDDEDPGKPQQWGDALAEIDRVTRKVRNRPNGAMTIYLDKAREFLAEKEIVIGDDDVWDLARAAVSADRLAKEALARRAGNDWNSDPAAERFPKWEEVEPKINERKRALTVKKYWDDFIQESHLKPGTVKRWPPVLEALGKFVGTDDLAKVTPEDMNRWKKALLETAKLSSRTVNDVYLAATRSFFDWAMVNQKATKNPAVDTKVRDKGARSKIGTPLKLEQAEAILAESLRPVVGRASAKFSAAMRWVPWICAYTGARINEITQLRKEDVYISIIDGEEVWVIRITPEAGTVKTDKQREAPLHPHLVEQGFIAFVKQSGPGPLFYNPKLARGGSPANPPYAKVGNKIAEWVRDYAIGNANVQPNHGWRHKFNQDARDVRMDPEVRDAITGHAPRTEGEKYGGNVPLKVKWQELLRLERYDIQAPTTPPTLQRVRVAKVSKKGETPKNAGRRHRQLNRVLS
jgi:integrase